jgi:hypothetical protein
MNVGLFLNATVGAVGSAQGRIGDAGSAQGAIPTRQLLSSLLDVLKHSSSLCRVDNSR